MRDLSPGHLAQTPAENFSAIHRAENSDDPHNQFHAAIDQPEPDNADATRFDGFGQLSERPKVYVIDDDRSVRRALTRLLATNGMDVHAFESAEVFLADLDTLPRGSLIVDIQLGGNGWA